MEWSSVPISYGQVKRYRTTRTQTLTREDTQGKDKETKKDLCAFIVVHHHHHIFSHGGKILFVAFLGKQLLQFTLDLFFTRNHLGC
jgi:hypothetical protein